MLLPDLQPYNPTNSAMPQVVSARYSSAGDVLKLESRVEVSVGSRRVAARVETQVFYLNGGEKIRVNIDTQVGCGMMCDMCAHPVPEVYVDGEDAVSLLGNLSAEQMEAQVHNARLYGDFVKKPFGVSTMGSGEPPANRNIYDALSKISRLEGLGHITTSTIASSDVIVDRLAAYVVTHSLPVELQVSLHGSTDQQRWELVPKGMSVRKTIDAAKRYQETTGQKVHLNYLLTESNSTTEDVARLTTLLKGTGIALKVSPLNGQVGKYVGVDNATTATFVGGFADTGIKVYISNNLGFDVDAGCGMETQIDPLERVDIVVGNTDRGFLVDRSGKLPSTNLLRGQTIGNAIDELVSDIHRVDGGVSPNLLEGLVPHSSPGRIIYPVRVDLPIKGDRRPLEDISRLPNLVKERLAA